LYPDIFGGESEGAEDDGGGVEAAGVKTVSEQFGWYFFLMQLADDDLVKFKTILYYPIEELLYNYMYRLNIKRASNVKQL
jgi:hypothetical protein